MARAVEPRVFLIAETTLLGNPLTDGGLHGFLSYLGVPGWNTDAHSGAEKLCEIAGKSCYLSFSLDLNKNLTKVGARSNFDYLQKGIIGTKHGSVLEHASMTFAICDVSRVFTHELVRHRAGCAYSQVSGRYVRTDEINYFLPKVIQGGYATDLFHQAFTQMEQWAHDLELCSGIGEMKNFDLKKKLTSAFRRLIGNGQVNHIIFTCNHRALRNIIELRTSRHAEEEIRNVFEKVFKIVHDRYPAIYADNRVEMVDGYLEVTFVASKV